MRIFILLFLFSLLLQAGEYDLVKLTDITPGDLKILDRMGVVINEVGDGHLIAEVPKSLLPGLRESGYQLEIIHSDIDDFYRDNYERKGPYSVYLSYTQYRDSMIKMAQTYPHICRLETLGYSHQNRLLLAMKISDNPQVDEVEPALHLEGNIHGNEKITWGVNFLLVGYLLKNYATNPQIKDLIDNREIWIAPMVNPDGYNSSSRYNARWVDLNRNWGWMWGNEYACGSDFFSENESWKFMEHFWRHPFVIYASYHAGTIYISEPWSYSRYLQPPEQNLIRHLSQGYSRYTGYPYGQGSVGMYPINGCTKDYDYGCGGEIGWSIEVCRYKTPPAESIDAIFYGREKDAMLYLIRKAGQGIHGTITDSVTGKPLRALIYVDNKWQSYSCPTNGDFHRFYLPGTYTVTVLAPGYDTKVIPDVTVPSTGDSSVTITVKLVPNPTRPIFATRLIGTKYVTASSNRTYPTKALGPHDNDAYRLDSGKWIVLAFDWPIRNSPGNDFTVYRSQGTGSATVKVSNNWRGPWTTIGTANSGQTQFDLASVGLDSVRYLRLEASSQFYLDAIEGVQVPTVTDNKAKTITGRFSIRPTIVRSSGRFEVIRSIPDQTSLEFYNSLGQKVRVIPIEGRNVKIRADRLTAGVYFVRIPESAHPIRLIVLR